MVGYLVTAGGVLWAWWLFDERLGPYIWLALALMLMGMAMVNSPSPRPRKKSGRNP